MFSAVHGDHSGRVIVAADYIAAGDDGTALTALEATVPLPPGSEVVPLPGEAEAVDRTGRRRSLGKGRLALGALLPSGSLRTHHPAVSTREPLPVLPLAALCADERGELRVAAVSTAAPVGPTEPAGTENAAREALRRRPSSRLVKQLARCARAYQCAGAIAALLAAGDAALPVAAAANERPASDVAPGWRADARPTDDAAFRPTPDEIADLAVAHLEGGGTRVSFGRACEGEPLAEARLIEESIRRVRARTSRGSIHAETNASSSAALRRLFEAGLDAITVRLASARVVSYEAIHAPVGYRWSDVRASLHLARDAGVAIEIALLVLPGLTDRASEIDAVVELLGELPRARLVPRDLAADPRRLLARLERGDAPSGVASALARISREVPYALAGIG